MVTSKLNIKGLSINRSQPCALGMKVDKKGNNFPDRKISLSNVLEPRDIMISLQGSRVVKNYLSD